MLRGLRVVDMSRVLAGPYCTMLLGDHGADVIKLEKLGVGDDTRKWGPPFKGDQSCYFLCVNRNKRSMAVDIKSPGGRSILIDLIKDSDVLVENFVPGTMAKLGLSYDDVKMLNPKLVYCSLSGYGQNSTKPGYDVIASAEGGLMSITGESNCPVKVGVAITDICTGLSLYGALMTALLYRERTGMGQYVHTSLFETQLAMLVNIASNFLNAGTEAKRWGTAHPSIVPYQAFETADGHIVIGAGNDSQYQKLIEFFHYSTGYDTLVSFTTNAERVSNRNALIKLLSSELLQNTTQHWCNLFEGSSFPFGPINSIEQAFSHPQTDACNMIESITHPTAGLVKFPGFPVKFSDTNPEVSLPPPLLGQHTRTILQSLGYANKRIDELYSTGVVE